MDSTDLLDDVLTLPSAAPAKPEAEDVEVSVLPSEVSFAVVTDLCTCRTLPLLPRWDTVHAIVTGCSTMGYCHCKIAECPKV